MKDKMKDETLPVMMYLHGFMSGANGSKQRQLQEMFRGRYRVIAPELDADIKNSIKIIQELKEKEKPEIIIGSSLGGFMAMLIPGNADVVVVNPVTNPYQQLARWVGQEQTYFCKRLDGVQTYTLTQEVIDNYKGYDITDAFAREWDRGHLSALCSSSDELLGDTHITLLSRYINPGFLMVADDFGHQCKGVGMTHLKELIEKVIARREFIKHSAMTFDQYAEMVRRRPIPETPGYYHLDVYAFNHKLVNQENSRHCYLPSDHPIEFERHFDPDNTTYRIPLNNNINGVEPLGADFATREDAEKAMCEITGKEGLMGFIISRYGFGQLAHTRFPIEQWMYDNKGRLVQKLSCSTFHRYSGGTFGKFFGHETLPYKVGNKVMILHRYAGDKKMYAVPAIIVGESDELKEGYDVYKSQLENWIRKGNSPTTWIDETCYPDNGDDEYFVQFGSYDSGWRCLNFKHPFEIFPLPFSLPKEIEDEMEEWYQEYRSHNSD